MKLHFTIALSLTIISWFALAPGLALASHEPELFETHWIVSGHDLSEHAVPDHARSISLRPGVLGQRRFVIELWEGEQIVAVRTRREVRPGGSITWLGQVEGYPGSHVSLTAHRGRIAGSIFFGERLFEFSSTREGSFFFEVDTALLPPLPDPVVSGADGEQTAPPTAAAGTIQDLLVVYTPATRQRWGQAGIETMILDAVASANQAYQNSLIDLQLQLVGMLEIAYSETGNMGTALDRLQRTGDGFMDEVHTLRDQLGADLVALIDEDTNYCGIAYVMTSASSGFGPWAFSVTGSGCLSNQTLAHELGHNQGDAHDRANSNVAGVFDYSYGFRRCETDGTGFRTVMSYGCTGGFRILNFSNPNVSYGGFATGVDADLDPANSADNARSMNTVGGVTAAFRASVTVDPPAPPSGLLALATRWDAIDLDWVDAADNESGFRVERFEGASWTEIATLAANATHYQDNGLSPSTAYDYRVLAYNGAGSSDYSNTAGAITLPPPPPPATPGGIAALGLSGSEIGIDWEDVAIEDGFNLERSLDAVSWTSIASLPPGQTSYTDTGLDPATTCHYRVSAFNVGGSSGPSDVATASTDSSVVLYAVGESSVQGSAVGTFSNTFDVDGSVQTILEEQTNGKPSRRKSRLEHHWNFNLPSATATMFHLAASLNLGGAEDFAFELSDNGGSSWLPLAVVTLSSPFEQMALLPPGITGAVLLRVIDMDRTAGETSLDSIHIDSAVFVAEFDPDATPPTAPSNVVVQAIGSYEIAIAWQDASSDEIRFEIERSQDAVSWVAVTTTDPDATSFNDVGVAAGSNYWYRVRAVNGAGASDFSLSPQVTTPGNIVNISLDATGYKVKGRKNVDLTWDGASSANVTIERDGQNVATVSNTGSYTDPIGTKGGGSYRYRVCESGSSECSSEVTVAF